MSRAVKYFIIASFITLLLGFSKPSHSGFEANNVDIAIPTSAWLVGPANLSPVSTGEFSMPCVMMNQYSNGLVLRFSASDERVLALAVDFREDVFSAGKGYEVEIEVPPSFKKTLSASAYNAGTVLINTQEHSGDLYAALLGGKYLYVNMAGVKLDFALLGVRQGFERVSACYNEGPSTNGNQQDVLKEAAAPPSYKKALGQQLTQVSPAESKDDGILTPMPDGSFPLQEQSKTLLKELADLEAMMKNAADTLSNIEPASGREKNAVSGPAITMSAPPIQEQQPVKSTQKRQTPIGKPLAGSWGSPLHNPVQNKKMGMEQKDIVVSSNDKAIAAGMEKRWRAIRGNNLREVLDIWSKSANVRLIWKSDSSFSVPQSISKRGTFEQAVLALLEQYGKGKKPTGRIYIDPVLNQRVLLIESTGRF